MIQTYLNGGGSFFMASMGILSQLGEVPFARAVLQVAGFVQNPDPPAPDPTGDEDFGVPAILGAPPHGQRHEHDFGLQQLSVVSI